MRYIFSTLILFIFCACSSNTETPQYSFYHWKSKAKMLSGLEKQVNTGLDKVYLHYFDIDYQNDSYYSIKPKYVITEVDDWYKQQSITPVVYITNKTLKKIHTVDELAENIKQLVTEISIHHFGKALPDLQIDCDWTQQTKEKYFTLLNLLKQDYRLTATIRLHQLKYPDLTGIPPVEHGALMLYNMGDLPNMKQNSILSTEIIKSYINEQLSYPIDLDVALPIFSQTVIKNYRGKVRLLNFVPESLTDTSIFTPLGPNHFKPKRDTLFHGFFISPFFELKSESVPENDLLESIDILKNSKLNLKSIIYYHLDEACVNRYSISKISSRL